MEYLDVPVQMVFLAKTERMDCREEMDATEKMDAMVCLVLRELKDHREIQDQEVNEYISYDENHPPILHTQRRNLKSFPQKISNQS